MRNIEKIKRFKSKCEGWSSVEDHPHKFMFNGVEHTFDGYLFEVDGIYVNYLNKNRYNHITPDDVFKVVSMVIKHSGVKNYMGYCKKRNYYYTFNESQIDFI